MTLDEIAALRDDWDGQGAKAPLPVAVAEARRLAEKFRGAPADRVVAGPDGSVVFEWRAALFLSAEVSGVGVVEWMRERLGGGFQHWTEAI